MSVVVALVSVVQLVLLLAFVQQIQPEKVGFPYLTVLQNIPLVDFELVLVELVVMSVHSVSSHLFFVYLHLLLLD